MYNQHKSFVSNLMHEFWSMFLNGLFTILPITLTIALFTFSFKLLKSWLSPILDLLDYTPLRHIPHAEILVIILFVVLVGVVLRVFILRSLIHAAEDVIVKIPLIRPVYSGIKQLVDAFNFKKEKVTFKQVVCVEFPRKGMYSIGFLTGQMPPELSPSTDKNYYNIFIPTTPNPTTGYFIIVPEAELVNINLTRQEAMALIISGGIILPDQFKK